MRALSCRVHINIYKQTMLATIVINTARLLIYWAHGSWSPPARAYGCHNGTSRPLPLPDKESCFAWPVTIQWPFRNIHWSLVRAREMLLARVSAQ